MPRRPRPTTRRPPQHGEHTEKAKPAASSSRAKTVSTKGKGRIQSHQDHSESDSSSSGSGVEGFSEDEDGSDGALSNSGEDEDELRADAEPDAARVAQWVDEEELENISEEEEESTDGGENADSTRLVRSLALLAFPGK